MSQPAADPTGQLVSQSIGAVHGQYVLNDRLMAGYIEYPEGQQQRCIILCLPADADDLARRRFATEAMIGIEMTRDHKNLLTTLQFGQWPDGRLFIAFDCAKGRAVYEMLDELHGDYDAINRIAEATMRALMYLHKRDISHGSVAAENLLMGDDGIIRLGNLSRAKRECEPDDKANDRRALGALLLRLCLGVPIDTLANDSIAEFVPLDAPRELVVIIACCCNC